MQNLTFVTGNYGKYCSVKERFEKEGIEIKYFACDLKEASINDISVISRGKAEDAYEKVHGPVFVADTGFYIEDYPGKPLYPGAFVKRSGISSDINHLLEVMKDRKNRSCYFLDCLTYYDGEDCVQFYGFSRGILANEVRGNAKKNAKSNLWFVFIPDLGCGKTLAEMSDEELWTMRSLEESATSKFISWYKDKVMGAKVKATIEKKS